MNHEKDQEMLSKLITMTVDNSTLPVVVRVETEVVAGDEHNWWVGSIENVEIGPYYCDSNRDTILSDIETIERWIADRVEFDDDIPEEDVKKEFKRIFDEEVKTVIYLNIGTPE